MKVALIILDGFGLRAEREGNAIVQAHMPTLDELIKNYVSFSAQASGLAVGLPDKAPGSSEAGHMALGTGQIIEHPLQRVKRDIQNGTFFDNEAIKEAFLAAKNRESKVHLVGLLSDVDVHASSEIIYSLIEMAKKEDYPNKLFLHLFLDGRDTQIRSGQQLVEKLYVTLRNQGYGSIATLVGRYYAMDRDGRWDRIEKAFNLMTKGEGVTTESPLTAVIDSYAKGDTDEFMLPTVVDQAGLIEDGDSIIIFNQRADRIRQLTEKFSASGFSDSHILAFSSYYQPFPFHTMYDQQLVEPNLMTILKDANKKCLKITETERYAHLTYFFNGGVENPYANEERSFVPTPRNRDPKKHPTLGLKELTKRVTSALQGDKADLIVVNIPNPDVLGHTGDMKAVTEGLAAVDIALKRIHEAARDYLLIITADHGNCEYMSDGKDVRVEDTTSPVPVILVHESLRTDNSGLDYLSLAAKTPQYTLTDVPFTILSALDIKPPANMMGENMLEQRSKS